MDQNFNFFYWGPLLAQFSLPDDVIDEMREDADALDKVTQDFRHKLAGIIEEEKTFTPEQIEKYSKIIIPYIDSYFRHKVDNWSPGQTIPERVEYNLHSLWVNYQEKGEVNPQHTHGGDISFVIYLDVPEEISKEEYVYSGPPPGAIRFSYGQHFARPDDTIARKLLDYNTRVDKVPEKGMFYIFPSNLLHEVLPFKSDVTRISVSGNVYVKAFINDSEYEE